MRRLLHFALIAIMIVGAVVTYYFKYQAEEAAGRVADLREAIAAEEEKLDYLKAELSMLSQPARLQELVELHQEALGLAPIEPDQIGGFDEIPPRPLPENGGPGFAGKVSGEHTGAVRP